MWIYNQSTGELSRDGKPIWVGYSGKGEHRNNPDSERLKGLGPIPRGRWIFGMQTDMVTHLGPYAIPIYPRPGTETYYRSGFYLHGDNSTHDASDGCIIKSPRSARELVGVSTDRDLEVV